MALIDRFKEPSTYAGLAAVAVLIPVNLHGQQITDSIRVLAPTLPKAIEAAQSQNWPLFITSICAALPALAAIFLPEKKH